MAIRVNHFWRIEDRNRASWWVPSRAYPRKHGFEKYLYSSRANELVYNINNFNAGTL